MLVSNRCVHWSLAAALALSLTATARGGDYKIKLMRPVKVGDQMSVHIVTKSSETISALPNAPGAFTAELTGTFEALAVNDKTGSATKLRCTVTKLTRDDKELYPAGTVITGEKINKTDAFTIDGKPVDAANVPALSAVIELNDPNRSGNDDDIYGTDQPQKVGSSWEINAGELATDLTEEGLPIPAESLKGTLKLVDVSKVNGVDAMTLSAHITADGFKTALPGAAVTDGKLDMTAETVYPVDPSLPSFSAKIKMHMTMTLMPQNQPGQPVTMTVDRDTTAEQTPVKK
jgi:hypothetical protein